MTISNLPFPASLDNDIDQIERMIAERLRGRAIVSQIATADMTQIAERRLRIALVLLSAQLGTYQFERTNHAATAIGLIMYATNLHGALVDAAERRSEHVSEWPGMHANVPLMVGDYLFALAATEMALAPDARIIAYYSRSVMAFCEATLAPSQADDPAVALVQHTNGIVHSAASLTEAACRSGGVCGGLSQDQIDTLGRFGYDLGRCWFIRDEIAQLNLPLAPLRLSTPLIYAAEAAGSQISSLITQHPQQARALIEQYGGVERALADVADSLARTQATLLELPDLPARSTLAGLTERLFNFAEE